MIVDADVYEHNSTSAFLATFESNQDEEQAEVALRFRQLVDDLVQKHSADVYVQEETETRFVSMTKRIVDIENYLSIYIASGSAAEPQSVSGGQTRNQTPMSITLVQTSHGRATGTLVYESVGDSVVRRQEDEDSTGAVESQTIGTEDVRELEQLLGVTTQYDHQEGSDILIYSLNETKE